MWQLLHNLPGSALLAQAAETRTYFELTRLQMLTEWWHWLLLLGGLIGIITYVVWMYRRDSVELPASTSILLAGLRIACFLALLFFFLKLEKRTERQIVRNSRVAVLVDVSQSMGLQDPEAGTKALGPARIEQITTEFARGSLLKDLRKKHEVAVYSFSEQDRPLQVASFPKETDAADPTSVAAQKDRELAAALSEVQTWYLLLAIMAGVSVIFFGLYMFLRDDSNQAPAWAMVIGCTLLLVGLSFVGIGFVRHPYITPFAVLGWEKPVLPEDEEKQAEEKKTETPTPDKVDWVTLLAARGAKTRIGDSLQYIIDRERGGPIAGVVLISDGRSNAGADPMQAVELAEESGLAIHVIGMGSEARPVNIRVVDLEAPNKVYPEEKFALTGFIQASGLVGRDMRIELVSGPAEGEQGETKIEREMNVVLGKDGDIQPLKFEVTPEASGRRTYRLRVKPRDQDDLDKRDNEKTATVQIADRKARVLIISGGPSRDYTFLHNLLYRGKERKEAFVDILLQSGKPGMSQEADQILFEFPSEAKDLFEYDSIVAFDPDWEKLSDEQIELLDRWVAEKAGGLLLVAGPVNTSQWTIKPRGDKKIDTLRNLYPVVFFSRATGIGARFGSEAPVKLNFTREGLESDFLWLTDKADEGTDRSGAERAAESAAIWDRFDGFYGYYSAKEAKPAAQVLARYPDPQARVDGQEPIYMASQYYGAGRVFYLASGEMWRLRALDDAYFDQFYTNVLRWVSQGRLARDSNRGVLLVDKDRCLKGDTIAVRAHLTDPQFNPLTVETVDASVIPPNGPRRALTLRRVKDAARAGEYAGQFTADQEGDYRLELLPPQSTDERVLVAEVRSRVPDIEIERPQRDGVLLSTIAKRTGGDYFAGLGAAFGPEKIALATQLNEKPADQITYLPGTPDKAFDQRLMLWLLGAICGVLSLEWLIRRLNKLA